MKRPNRRSLAVAGQMLLAGVLPLLFSHCTTSSGEVAVQGELGTPSHQLPRSEYPFDSNGEYREDWVNTPRRVSVASSSPSPSGASSAETKSSRRQTYHTVANGDSLWSISRRYGVSVRSLKQENGLKSDLVRPGETLHIP